MPAVAATSGPFGRKAIAPDAGDDRIEKAVASEGTLVRREPSCALSQIATAENAPIATMLSQARTPRENRLSEIPASSSISSSS